MIVTFFFEKMALLIYNSQVKKFTPYNSVVFNVLTELCNSHHCPITEHFHHSKKKHHTSEQSLVFTTPSSLQQPLIYVSMDLPIYGHFKQVELYKYDLLYLAPFIQYNIFKFYPYCRMNQYFIIFSWLNNIALFMFNTFSSSIYALLYILVAFTFWLL